MLIAKIGFIFFARRALSKCGGKDLLSKMLKIPPALYITNWSTRSGFRAVTIDPGKWEAYKLLNRFCTHLPSDVPWMPSCKMINSRSNWWAGRYHASWDSRRTEFMGNKWTTWAIDSGITTAKILTKSRNRNLAGSHENYVEIRLIRRTWLQRTFQSWAMGLSPAGIENVIEKKSEGITTMKCGETRPIRNHQRGTPLVATAEAVATTTTTTTSTPTITSAFAATERDRIDRERINSRLGSRQQFHDLLWKCGTIWRPHRSLVNLSSPGKSWKKCRVRVYKPKRLQRRDESRRRFRFPIDRKGIHSRLDMTPTDQHQHRRADGGRRRLGRPVDRLTEHKSDGNGRPLVVDGAEDDDVTSRRRSRLTRTAGKPLSIMQFVSHGEWRHRWAQATPRNGERASVKRGEAFLFRRHSSKT